MKIKGTKNMFQIVILSLWLISISDSLPFYTLNGRADLGRARLSVKQNDLLKVTTTWDSTSPLQL